MLKWCTRLLQALASPLGTAEREHRAEEELDEP